MSLQEIRRCGDQLRSGRISPEAAVETVLPYVKNEARCIRRVALETLLAAAEREPAHATDIVDSVVERLEGDGRRPLSAPELRSLRDLARIRARDFRPIVEYLASVVRNPDEHATDATLAVGVVGEVGANAPGVAKPALEALLEHFDDFDETLSREAMWAFVRTVEAEPSVVRPLIAGRLWSLEDEDPATVQSALETLGRVGWVAPDQLVAVERIADCAAHPIPGVRETAVDALARIGGVSPEGTALGHPSREHAETALPEVLARLDDSSDDVRWAAIKALRWWGQAHPSLLEGCFERLCRLAGDDHDEIRYHALRLLGELYDARIIDGAETKRLERLFVRKLTDHYEVNRQAAMDGLGVYVRRLKADPETRPRARTLAELMVWRQLVVLPDERFPIVETFPLSGAELVELCDVETLVDVIGDACLRDPYEYADPIHGIEILGRLLKHAESVRWETLVWLLEQLGSDRSATRKAAGEVLEEAVASDARIVDAFGDLLLTQLAYEPKSRGDVGTVLAAAGEHDRELIADAIRLCLRAPTVEDGESDGGMSDIVAEALGTRYSESFDEQLIKLAHERPSGAADAIDALVGALSGDDPPLAAAIGVTNGVAAGGKLSSRHGRQICALLTDSEVSATMKAWVGTALSIGSADAERRRFAEVVLRSLFKRRDHDGIEEPLELLAANRPTVAAELLESVRRTELDRERKAALSALVTTDSRVLPSLRQYASVFEPTTAAEDTFLIQLAEAAPHAVRGDAVLAEPIVWDDPETLLAVVEAIDPTGGVDDHEDAAIELETWTRHPVVDVRERIEAGRRRGEKRTGHSAGGDPVRSPVEAIDTVARQLGSNSEAVSRRCCRRLIEAALTEPDHYERVVSHLLVYVSTARESTSRSIAVSTLAAIAQTGYSGTDRTGERSPRARIVQSYCDADPALARRAAVDALVEIDGSPPVDVLSDRLTDDDGLVRTRTIRAIERHVPRLVGEVLEPLRAALDGPAPIAAAACGAIGRYAETGSDVEAETVNGLRDRLAAEDRGVRRAAATALERIARHDIDVARRLSGTLLDRLEADTACRRELARAIETVPEAGVGSVDVGIEQLAVTLFETPYNDASAAAGAMLARLADAQPLAAGSRLRTLGAERIDGSDPSETAVTLTLSEYYLFEALTVCCDRKPTHADPYEPLVRQRVTDGPDPFSAASSVDPRAHRSAAMTIASLRGFECCQPAFEAALEGGPTAPADLDRIAAFLATVGGDKRDAVLGTVIESASKADVEHLIEALADGDVDRVRASGTVRALGRLLPETDDTSVQRIGIDTQLEHRDATWWHVRQTVARTLGELGDDETLPREEAIAHLLAFLDDDDRRVRETAAESIASLVRRSCLEAEWLLEAHRRRAADSSSGVAARSGSIALLGALARARPTTRRDAAEALTALLEDVPFRLRRETTDQLETLGGATDPI